MKHYSFRKNTKSSNFIFTILGVLFIVLATTTASAEDSIYLGVTNRHVDSVDLNLDFHQIPNTNVMFSKSIKTAGAKEAEKILGVDIEKITRAVLLEQFKVKGANEGFTISGNPEGDSLEITPWVFLRVLDNGQVLPWTVWNVQCMDLYWNKKKWEGVCFSSLARPRPLDGKGGWTSNNGEFLKQALEADARKLLELAKQDLKGVYKKSSFRSERMKGIWFNDKAAKEIDANFLETDPETLLIRYYDDRALDTVVVGGLTSLFLKTATTNTVLFNGSLVVPKQVVDMVSVQPKTTPTKNAGK